MNFTQYKFNEKSIAKLSLGCMRFPSKKATAETITECVKNGIFYLDTSPAYLYQSEQENCETWVGEAIQSLRDKIILSAKSAVGGWGGKTGYNPSKGYSIMTAEQVQKQISQSLQRLNVNYLDFYNLWAVHNSETFKKALQPDGWLEGVLKAQKEGLVKNIGITGHSESKDIKTWIDSGYFQMITIPFNIIDNSRKEVIQYAYEKHIPVMAMNPLAGGLLGSPSKIIANEMKRYDINTAYDMALRYCASFPGVSVLSGMTSKSEVQANVNVINKTYWTENDAEQIRDNFNELLGNSDYLCTNCKYCAPCPESIWIPRILKLRNYYVTLKLESAKRIYKNRSKNDKRFQAENCTECGECESKCPNELPVRKLLKEVTRIFK